MKIKIYYEDTDAAGVVYYAAYLRFLERARTECLLELGINVADLHNKGFLFPVTHVDIYYRKSTLLGETIEVITEITEIKNASLTFKNRIMRDETLMVEAEVTVACIDRNGRPQRLPDEVKNALTST